MNKMEALEQQVNAMAAQLAEAKQLMQIQTATIAQMSKTIESISASVQTYHQWATDDIRMLKTDTHTTITQMILAEWERDPAFAQCLEDVTGLMTVDGTITDIKKVA